MRNIRAILGFLVKAEVDAIFRQQPFELVNGEPDPFTAWRASCKAIRNLSPTPLELEVGLIDESKLGVIGEVRSRSTFARYYEAVDDYQFAVVPVEGLLSPQWFADLDYVHELSSQISESASMEELVRFTMMEGSVTEPIINGAHVIFNSDRPDLHADQIPSVREIGHGEFEIVVRAGSRPNYVQVAMVGGRLILTNGVHRVCALHLRGYANIPCLLRKVSRIEEAGLNLQTSLFRPELIGGPRPAQVVDFLQGGVAATLKLRSMQHVLRIAIGVDMIKIPAIPNLALSQKKEPVEQFPNTDMFRSGPEGYPTASI